jgi:hypothetical protein
MLTFRNTLSVVSLEAGRYDIHTYLPIKMEWTDCSETLAYKIQMPGNYPEESIKYSEHGESLKSRSVFLQFNFISSLVRDKTMSDD